MNQTLPIERTFPINDFWETKYQVLNWVEQFSTFCFLDNHQYQMQPHSMECLLAAGEKRFISANAGHAIDQLQHFRDAGSGWLFGHLGYDLKNEIEQVSSSHPDLVGFPDLYFFEPEILIRINETSISITADEPESIFKAIASSAHNIKLPTASTKIESRLSRDEYIRVIETLRQHILRGDCYEINFCQEFFAEHAIIDPVSVYRQLSDISPNPFSALYRVNDQWLICASPERFLSKKNDTLLSQPIKGTSKRVIDNEAQDEQSRNDLQHSAKDRSENVMVVDLVRNDLARICVEGSVVVDELYGVYSFPQVHQMISTIGGVLPTGMQIGEILRATFPMGSMTGAPKKRVMQLIEQYEITKRGIFSGAVGYITPEDDFDFNVVIRSIMYNAQSKYLSFQVGSGITFYSDPASEWEECMMKASAMKAVLEKKDQ